MQAHMPASPALAVLLPASAAWWALLQLRRPQHRGTCPQWQTCIDEADEHAPSYVILAPFCIFVPIRQGTTYYLRPASITVGPTRPLPDTATVSAAMVYYGPTSDLLRLHADLSARPPHLEALVAHAALVKARDSNVGMKAANVSQVLHELGDASLCRASAGWLAKELQEHVMQLGDEQHMHEMGLFLRQGGV
jgi:hypothetical protein